MSTKFYGTNHQTRERFRRARHTTCASIDHRGNIEIRHRTQVTYRQSELTHKFENDTFTLSSLIAFCSIYRISDKREQCDSKVELL